MHVNEKEDYSSSLLHALSRNSSIGQMYHL